MLNFDDKRSYYRMMLNSDVVITINDNEANTQFFATCRDLSATGMAVEMSQPLELGTEVSMRIDSSSNSIAAFDAKGKVVRAVEENPDCYLIGIAITTIE
jgi:c-di-GMP-binding flagellar brake protein YcgR